jgi:hypothetical protein
MTNSQMKIERNQIRVTGQSSSLDAFNNLKEGSRLAVKIVEKLGQRHAVLDIGGRRVNAEFLQGIPKSGNFFLILDNKVKDTLFFRIADGSLKEDLLGELNKSTIFNLNDLNKSIHELRLYLREGMYSIFLLNKALLKYTDFVEEEKKNEKLKNLLNKLLSKGADYKDLLLMTDLINQGKSSVADLFYFILSRIIPDYKHLFEKNNITGKIADFFDFINNSFTEDNKDEKIEVIRTILDIYLNKPEKENTRYSEIIYFDDNKFKQCRYILNENNIILSLDLSYLGNINILIKYENSFFSISFFCLIVESITAL